MIQKTKQTIDALLAEVKQHVKDDDNEAAHASEDELRNLVLQTILKAKTLKEAKELAKTALKTNKLDFQHWYA